MLGKLSHKCRAIIKLQPKVFAFPQRVLDGSPLQSLLQLCWRDALYDLCKTAHLLLPAS